MKFALILIVAGVASAGRLENTYLPPGSAASAGGAGFIHAPAYTAVGSSGRPGVSGGFGGFGGSGGVGGGAGGFGVHGGSAGAPGPVVGGGYQGSGNRHGQFVEITRFNNQNNGDGSYQYNYEAANGISAEESGALQGDSEVVKGSYSYTGPDGVQYTIHYTADENGFHPEGAHLPTPPPIPEEIRRGVELSLAAEARGENQDGQYRPSGPQGYNKYQTSGQVGAGASAGYHY
ncbi:pupal cuticle protein 20 [Cephus cinctus]|uniref:Pupal cuticle protein 20 n=1 Tax=Cephus cinctus TaxID=211228 RepID=A0AAJ7CFX2_CEPCN|nr:pupal cuticle protein 20 [Cephus cinctus]